MAVSRPSVLDKTCKAERLCRLQEVSELLRGSLAALSDLLLEGGNQICHEPPETAWLLSSAAGLELPLVRLFLFRLLFQVAHALCVQLLLGDLRGSLGTGFRPFLGGGKPWPEGVASGSPPAPAGAIGEEPVRGFFLGCALVSEPFGPSPELPPFPEPAPPPLGPEPLPLPRPLPELGPAELDAARP